MSEFCLLSELQNRCIEKWTVIGYQDEPIDNTAYLVAALTHGSKTEPLTTFFDLQVK